MRIVVAFVLILAACGSAAQTTTTSTSPPPVATTSTSTTVVPDPPASSTTTTTTTPAPEAIVLDHAVIRITLPSGVITDWNNLVAVGPQGWVVVAGDVTEKGVPGDPGFWHTADGTDWASVRLLELVPIEFVEITDLVYFSGRFVASLMGDASIVDPTIVVSDDGLEWTAGSISVGGSAGLPGVYATPESPPWPGASAITDLEVHGDELVAVGWVQTNDGSSPAFWRTHDTVTWSRSLLPNQVSQNEWANEVAVGEAGYLVTGLGPFHQPDYLWASSDGSSWKPVQLTKEFFFGHQPAVADSMWAFLTFDDGPEEMYRSDDGIEWVQMPVPELPLPQQSWGREVLVSGDQWLLLVNVEGQGGWMVSSAGDTLLYPLGNGQHFAEVFSQDVLVARSNDEVEVMPIYLDTAARVVDVASDDVLNVRSGPGVAFDIVATLGHQATDILVVDSAENGWNLILGPTGQVGWVNGAFLELADAR